MTMQRKHIGILLGVLAVVAVVWLANSGRQVNAKQTGDDSARTVAVTLVKRSPIVNSLTLSGAFRPYQQVDVHAKLPPVVYLATSGPVRAHQPWSRSILDTQSANRHIGKAVTMNSAYASLTGRSSR
jgi:hypothetical protein